MEYRISNVDVLDICPLFRHIRGVVFEIRTYVCDPVTSGSRELSAVREFTSARFSFLVGSQCRGVR